MKRLYFETKSVGKCGCGNYNWYYTDKYQYKKDIKALFPSWRSTKVVRILTEEQMTRPEIAKEWYL